MSAPAGRPGGGAKPPGWWDKLAPKQKQMLIVAGAVGGFFLVTVPLLSTNTPPPQAQAERQVGELLPASKARDLGLTGLARDVDSLEAQLKQRDREIEALKREMTGTQGQLGTVNPAVAGDIERLRARLEMLERGGQVPPADPGLETPGLPASFPAQPQAPVPQAPAGTLGDPAARGQQNTAPPPPPPIPQMRIISGAKETTEADVAAPEEPALPKFYLPSGSMISGVLITGLDAATGRAASQDPTPALVKIDAEAILPNRYRADIAGCHALLAGRGDLSSERAFLRGESLSCVTHQGGVIDIPLNVYAVGEDGKAGLRGTLVSKQGQAIGKAMLAGLAEGTSQAFSQSRNNGFSGGGLDLANSAESGAYGGFGSALERVAAFYIDLANQIFPVVEISAGRPVTLVVVKGTEVTALR